MLGEGDRLAQIDRTEGGSGNLEPFPRNPLTVETEHPFHAQPLKFLKEDPRVATDIYDRLGRSSDRLDHQRKQAARCRARLGSCKLGVPIPTSPIDDGVVATADRVLARDL